jgi:anti-sigma regulatory factor (Ser/Thr protein kinase)
MSAIGVRRSAAARHPTAPAGPSDRALDKLAGRAAIALRLSSAVTCAVVGPLAAAGGVSAVWLAVVITVLCGWSAAFAWRVHRSGLSRTLVLADLVVIAAIVATQGHVVPAAMTADGTSWILPLASTAIYISLLALRPVIGLPALALVAVAYVATVPHPADAWFLVVQATVTAILVGLIRRSGRKADAVVGASLQAEQELRAEAADRADEREHHRQLHDTMLSTLTMVAAGAFDGPSPTLSAQAARDLDVVRGIPTGPPGDPARPTDLRARLEQVTAAAPLRARLTGAAVTLPRSVTEGIAASVAEALRNVARHAGVDEAEVSVRGGAGWATVEVTDRGRGFDLRSVAPAPRGIRESISGRMIATGGTGVVTSAPGRGTTVVLRWPG